MNRIAPLHSPFPASLAQRFARLVPATMTAPVLFRAVARNEGLFNFLVDSRFIGPTGLLDRRCLDSALREAVILRVCVACGNDYEWRLHVGTISARMGLTPEQIAGMKGKVIWFGSGWQDAIHVAGYKTRSASHTGAAREISTFAKAGVPITTNFVNGGHAWYVWRILLKDFLTRSAFLPAPYAAWE